MTSRKRLLFASLTTLLAVLMLASPVWAQKQDISPLVVVGDSLSAGYQNGSLLGSQQVNGYANLVAIQANAPLNLPLINPPGVPPVLALTGMNGSFPVIEPISDTPPANPREDPTLQATDLAVPGATVADALNKTPCIVNTPTDCVMTTLVLGFPGAFEGKIMTQVQWAQALHPETIILWIGNNDALGAATSGSSDVTPLLQFADTFAKVVNELRKTHAKLVIANIPDVTSVPYFFSVPKLAALFNAPQWFVMLKLRVGPGDYVVLDSVPKAAAILAGVPGAPPLSDSDVLTALEAAKVRAAVNAYNFIIAFHARQVGAALVDINALFKDVSKDGYSVNGQLLTTNFLGGIFSLDGIHPTNTGYAVVANEFIKDMNHRFRWHIPPVDVADIAAKDPLILPATTQSTQQVLRQGALNQMRSVLKH